VRRITSTFFWCSVCSWAACATSQTVTAGSDFVSQGVFVDAVLAEPPQQRVPWTAPKSRLPKEFIAATTSLFNQGMADPRGCQYREVAVRAYDFRDAEAKDISTHGWVIPDAADRPTRLAICWNGVVYPLVAAGKPADYRADVLDAIRAKRVAFGIQTFLYCGSGPGLITSIDSFEPGFNIKNPPVIHKSYEITTTTYRTVCRLWACILLRVGAIDLAEVVWEQYRPDDLVDNTRSGHAPNAAPEADSNQQTEAPYDPYLELASDWTWPLYDRAFVAHLRGDDRLALAASERLATIWNAVQTEGAEHDTEHPHASWFKKPRPVYLERIASIRELLADQQRRAADRNAGKSPPVAPRATDERLTTLSALKQALGRCSDQKERIALLVRELEEVSALESVECLVPCEIGNADPIVRLLVAEGEPAIKPLIECLAHDPRLTRSFGLGSYGQDATQHEPRGVGDAASVALAAIFQESFFEYTAYYVRLPATPTGRRKALAQKMQNFYEHDYRLPRYERCYQILRDDRAPLDSWCQAAATIGSAANPNADRGFVIDSRQPLVGLVPRPKMPVEPLRTKKNPSLTELLEQRLGEVPSTLEQPMLAALVDWDPKAALKLLQELTKDTNRDNDPGARRHILHGPLRTTPKNGLVLKRAKLGDPTALPEYAIWAKAHATDDGGYFAPLLQFPDDPAIHGLAQWLFNDPASPLKSVAGRMVNQYSAGASPFVQLLVVPAFRDQVVRLLADRSPAGRVTIDGGAEKIELLIDGKVVAVDNAFPRNSSDAPPNATNDFRVCDLVARNLSAIRGLPRCELYAPVVERDRAAAECLRIVKQYGHCFKGYYGGFHCDNSIDFISLPRLKRTATREDVQAGRAVFSLDGQGPVRVVRLGEQFDSARWTTSKDAPFARTAWDPKAGKNTMTIDYDQDGRLCQAEEVHVGGKWKRYYGFIGRHSIAQVPAEEIDFSRSWYSACVDKFVFFLDNANELDIDGHVNATGPFDQSTIRLFARNCTPFDRQLPRFSIDEKNAPKSGAGIKMLVQMFYLAPRRGDTYESQSVEIGYNDDTLCWRELAREPVPLALRASARWLAPLEQCCLLQFKWRDHFRMAGPGFYKVRITLAADGQSPIDGPKTDVSFFVSDGAKDASK